MKLLLISLLSIIGCTSISKNAQKVYKLQVVHLNGKIDTLSVNVLDSLSQYNITMHRNDLYAVVADKDNPWGYNTKIASDVESYSIIKN